MKSFGQILVDAHSVRSATITTVPREEIVLVGRNSASQGRGENHAGGLRLCQPSCISRTRDRPGKAFRRGPVYHISCLKPQDNPFLSTPSPPTPWQGKGRLAPLESPFWFWTTLTIILRFYSKLPRQNRTALLYRSNL